YRPGRCSSGEPLVRGGVEVPPEGCGIDVRAGRGKPGQLRLGDKGAPSSGDWPQLSDRRAVASDQEGLASRDRVDDLRILVAKLALGDGAWHVADRSTNGYGSSSLWAEPRFMR